jgi:hypothetical protein
MTPAIAILTFRRSPVLRACLESIRQHCPGYRLAIFEDCANFDDTAQWLAAGSTRQPDDPELAAEVWQAFDYTAFLGARNLGVSGNTNRAIRWFERDCPECDQLLVLNDDVLATGDFPKAYGDAHQAFKVGLWCFCDFTSEEYQPVPLMVKGKTVHVLPRMTGMAMSLTRRVVEDVGYFEADVFGKFGEEHVSYTHRCRFSGHLKVNGVDQHCLDVPGVPLASQPVGSSINPNDKPVLDSQASQAMQYAAAQYQFTSPYRPFSLGMPRFVGAYGGTGMQAHLLRRLGDITVVDGWVPA